MGNCVRLNPQAVAAARRQVFLDHLAATCDVKGAAEAAGIHFTNFYQVRRRDQAFADEWRAAMRTGYERIEARLMLAAGAAAEAAETEFDAKMAIEVLKIVLQRDLMELRGPRAPRGQVARAKPEETDAAILKGLEALAKRKTL